MAMAINHRLFSNKYIYGCVGKAAGGVAESKEYTTKIYNKKNIIIKI